MTNDRNYQVLLDIARARSTNRAFRPDYVVPDEHYEQILEVARHAPSGANSQPWHCVVVCEQALKDALTDCLKSEQRQRAKLKMKFPTPNYEGLRTAPGLIVVAADFRFARELSEALNWDRFDPAHFMGDEELDEWIRTRRHKVMFKDEKNVD